MSAGADEARPRVLVVDDEPLNLETFKRSFRRQFDMAFASSGDEALHVMSERTFDVALVDYAMPGMNGVELLKEASRRAPAMHRLIVTAHAEISEVRESAGSGLTMGIILKPWRRDEITKWVTRVCKVGAIQANLNGVMAKLRGPT